MLGEALVYIFENVIFWAFVYIIVFMGCDTPAIVFTGFGFFLFYWLFRFVFRKQGVDRVIWLYVVNMFVSILLLYYFMTGNTIQKSLRSFLNSTARKVPGIEPYVKRC